MTSTMLLRSSAAAAALAALGAAAVLGFESQTAEAASNPFAGKFVGAVPGTFLTWPISINGSGRIGSKVAYDPNAQVIGANGSFDGTVDRAGHMTCSGIQYFQIFTGGSGRIFINFTATATVNADGDIVGTTDTGATFVWTRQ